MRSTSSAPRSESARAREPFEDDHLMGIGSVGPSCDEGDELGLTDGEDSEPQKYLKDCPPRLEFNLTLVLGKARKDVVVLVY